ncbi:uncharacterized protein PV07_07980 [Cladophialophora immunda]|uniref:Uncharacterized protein n=1 Tax=Cladophialophora immunda TaxID=569365 RepID=A0A0D2CXE7_9EURO|nr:uncharacterized protein PV07_07980 [Cladophialophora immunda]KIW28304.1 hypothetical protein PV07_07980 [Cladophialophora immunda]OQV10967.1 hypothetical protein CLAIMM_14884 [Cladophialophora immunda]
MPASTFSVLVLLIPRLAAATCYWQNSTLAPDDPYSIAPDDTACFPDQENSACCGTGWTCLSDGVCYIEQEGNSFYYRGTCTDRTWDSQQCPGWCFAQNANTSIPLLKCDTAQDWYCCPGDSECSCDTGKDVVKLGDTQPSTVTVIGSTSWPGISSTTSPFVQTSPLVADGTSTSESGGLGQSTTSSDTRTSSTPTSSPTTSSATAAAASATSGTPAPSKGGGSSNTGLAAGLGAGLGAAAVIIGVLLFVLIRKRRHGHAEKVGPADGGYGGLLDRDQMMQKPFSVASQPASPYADSQQQAVAEAPAAAPAPHHSRPELAGAGEYDRVEMPTGHDGDGLHHRRSTERAELGP